MQVLPIVMVDPIRVGLALPSDHERTAVAAWLEGAEMAVERLLEGCRIDDDITDRALGCVVADGAALQQGYLASLRRQDPRLPVVAIVNRADDDAGAFRRGVTAVVRPLDGASLVLAVSLALGEGRQARGSRRTRTSRVASRVSGVSASILDLSPDGVRLELPTAAASRLAPHFRLQVPMVALDLVVRRAWVGRARGGLVQCGATLVDPDPSQRLAWQRLIDLASSRLAIAEAVDEPRPQPLTGAERGLLGRVSNLLAGVSPGGWSHHLSRLR